MREKKEFIKSITLLLLIFSSIILTFNISGYKPNYDILGASSDKKKAHQDYNKLHNNSLKLLSPYIIIKKNKNSREEKSLENSIVKVNNILAINDISVIKNILSKISNVNVKETRIRNRDIKNVIDESEEYYVFNYKNEIDTLSSKNIYLSDNNQTLSFNFDNVLISDSKKNNLYLYKKGTENYLQIEFENDIYTDLELIFKNNYSNFTHYVVDARKDIYIKTDNQQYYVDSYNYVENDLYNVASNIFIDNNNIKISNKDNETKEITDGYSIIRTSEKIITYINPSNITKDKNNINLRNLQEKATSFLVSGYIPKIDYTFLNINDNCVIYKEIYKNGLVFSENDDNSSDIKIKVSKEGVYQAEFPNQIRDTQISSELGKIFLVDNISEVLNYLYSNLKLKEVDDIVLGYEKTYQKDKITYTPSWYIKYKGEYIKYIKLKDKVKRGEI